MPHSMWDLSSLTRDQTFALCIGSVESSPPDCQRSQVFKRRANKGEFFGKYEDILPWYGNKKSWCRNNQLQQWSSLSLFTFTFHFHALEKEMATHSSVLAWRIPGTGEPAGLLSMGSHRVGHDWSDLAVAAVLPYYHQGNDQIPWLGIQGLSQTIPHWLLQLLSAPSNALPFRHPARLSLNRHCLLRLTCSLAWLSLTYLRCSGFDPVNSCSFFNS